MNPRYVGFYWTRPVPSHGFNSLPQDADGAAKMSRTVRYQRELVRRYVKDEKGELLGEVVFLEVAPDRGTPYINDQLQKAADLCAKHQASLLYVEFWSQNHWRRSHHMLATLKGIIADKVECIPLEPLEIEIDGVLFDPFDHFQKWDESIAEDSRRRRSAAQQAVTRLANEHVGYGRYARIALQLNASGVETISGKGIWTADNVRQLIKYRMPPGSRH